MITLNGQRKTLKLISLIIIGIILFGFGGMLTKPIFYNSSLKPSMAILAIFAAILGPLAGFLIGFFGHWITDIMMGLGISPFWIIGTGIVGIGIGLFPWIMNYELQNGIFDQKSFLVFLTLTFVSNFVGYLFSAIFDYFMLSEELNKVITQQIFVAITNTALIGLIGSPILKLIAFINLKNITNTND